MKKSGDWGLKMMIFVTAFLEAEISRFSDQSQKNFKKVKNLNLKS